MNAQRVKRALLVRLFIMFALLLGYLALFAAFTILVKAATLLLELIGMGVGSG